MKTHLVTFLLSLLSITLFSQVEGEKSKLQFGKKGDTYAVVIGISEYQEIDDLNFAHRDAAIFKEYLQSKSGGSVAEENIKLLTNEAATLAAMKDAFNWLLTTAKKDDRVFIYFSGHGDIENELSLSSGFLLTHDTPFNNYLLNAFEIDLLNKIIVTLSLKKKAQVVLITDACHSGNLAGSRTGGVSLTPEQVDSQAVNEVRITSCKPNQKSFEGEQWGGGRGAFSYHLVNGLYGMAAEEDDDLAISLYELKNYLRKKLREDKVKKQLINKDQFPQTSNNENFIVGRIVKEDLAAWQQQLNLLNQLSSTQEDLAMVEAKGVADENIEFRSIKDLENTMNRILEWQSRYSPSTLVERHGEYFELFFNESEVRLMSSENMIEGMINFEGLVAFIEKFTKDKTVPDFAKRQLAIACANTVQNSLNNYLKGSSEELKSRYFARWEEKYSHLPYLLGTAMELLPEDHLLQEDLKVKLHYFNGLQARFSAVDAISFQINSAQAIEHQNAALALNDKVPYVHNELGILHSSLGEKEKAEFHFRQAMDLAPTWALPRANLGGLLIQKSDFSEAKTLLEKAKELQPDYSGVYVNLGNYFEKSNQLLHAEEQYQRAAQLNNYHYLPFEKLGYLYLKINII